MPLEQYANFYTTTIGASLNATQTNVTVAVAPPSTLTTRWRFQVDNELMLVTGVSGTTLTVTRGAEGSTAATHASGAVAKFAVTAASMKASATAGQGVANVTDYGAKGDGTTNDTAAFTAAIASALDIYVPPGTFMTTQLTLSTAGLRMRFARGAIIKLISGTNADHIVIAAADMVFDGGTFDGNKSGQTSGTGVVVNSGGARTRFIDCTFQNSHDNGVVVTGANAVEFDGCRLTSPGQNGFFFIDDATDGSVHDCRVTSIPTTGGFHCVAAHSNTAGKNVSGFRCVDNYLEPGSGFAIEVGGFGGDRPTSVVCANNRMKSVASGHGGISFDSVDGGLMSGNNYNANSIVQDNASYELAACTTCLITGNISRAPGQMPHPISVDRSSRNSVTGNVCYGGANGGGYAMIHVTSSQTSQSADDNVVQGNTLVSVTGETHPGIHVQSNATSASCNRNSIVGNTIIGVGSGNGILLELNTGQVDNNVVVGNSFTGWTTKINVSGATNTVNASNN